MRHEDVVDRLPEFVLGLVTGAEGVLIDEHLTTCSRCAEHAHTLNGVHRVAGTAAGPAPTALKSKVLESAFAARTPVAPPAADGSSISTWEIEMARFQELMRDVQALGDDSAWTTTAIAEHDLSVRGVVCHLIASESAWLDRLGDGQLTPETETNLEVRTRQVVERHQTLSVSESLAELAAVVDAVRRELERLDDEGLRSDSGMLPNMTRSTYAAFRAFETWIHADDVREALGWPTTAPPPSGLAAMGAFIEPWVTLAFRKSDRDLLDQEIRVELTGDGGGIYDVGPTWSGQGALIRADVVAFCKLAGARHPGAAFDYSSEGDPLVAARAVKAIPLLAGM